VRRAIKAGTGNGEPARGGQAKEPGATELPKWQVGPKGWNVTDPPAAGVAGRNPFFLRSALKGRDGRKSPLRPFRAYKEKRIWGKRASTTFTPADGGGCYISAFQAERTQMPGVLRPNGAADCGHG